LNDFCTFLKRANPKQEPVKTLLSLDPGETTGFAVFERGHLGKCLHLRTKPIDEGVDGLNSLIGAIKPDVIVYESYRVYGWKTEQHAYSDLHTPQLIGAIQTIARLKSIPVHSQSAQVAKQFCTDMKLKEWGVYERGFKHGRDAVRHGCYFLLFNQHKVPLA